MRLSEGGAGTLDWADALGPAPGIFVSTGEARDIAPAGADLTGELNDGSLAASWYFQYGESPNYTLATSAETIAESAASQAVTSHVNIGLQPNTTYHFRLVMTQEGNPTYGQDETFTTPNGIAKTAPPLPAGQPGEGSNGGSTGSGGEPPASSGAGPAPPTPAASSAAPCRVPRLVSLPLQNAVKRAQAAHCLVVKVKWPSQADRGKTIVLSQEPRAGALRPWRAHIEVRLGVRRG